MTRHTTATVVHRPPTSTPQPASAAHSLPQLVRCESTADFLAALPRLVGFTAPDSLFIVLFSGSRAQGTLRVDLPDSETAANLPEYFDELVSCLLSAQQRHGTSAPALVIASSLSFAEAEGLPWGHFARELERRLTRIGQRPRELCCLAPDGWASLYDPAPPRLGHPISDIEASPAHGTESVPSLAELGVFREVPAAERLAVESLADERLADEGVADESLETERFSADEAGADAGGGGEAAAGETGVGRAGANDAGAGGEPGDKLGLAGLRAERAPTPPLGSSPSGPPRGGTSREHQLERARAEIARLFGRHPLTPHEAARLLRVLRTDVGWACAFDELAASTQALHTSEAHPAGAAQRSSLSRVRSSVTASPRAIAARAALSRLTAASEHLAYLVPLTPRAARPSLIALCALAWWARGLESVAQRQLAQALALDPEHEIARLAARVIRTGRFVPPTGLS